MPKKKSAAKRIASSANDRRHRKNKRPSNARQKRKRERKSNKRRRKKMKERLPSLLKKNKPRKRNSGRREPSLTKQPGSNANERLKLKGKNKRQERLRERLQGRRNLRKDGDLVARASGATSPVGNEESFAVSLGMRSAHATASLVTMKLHGLARSLLVARILKIPSNRD